MSMIDIITAFVLGAWVGSFVTIVVLAAIIIGRD